MGELLVSGRVQVLPVYFKQKMLLFMCFWILWFQSSKKNRRVHSQLAGKLLKRKTHWNLTMKRQEWIVTHVTLGFQPPLKQWVEKYNHHYLPKVFHHPNWVNHYFNGGGSPGPGVMHTPQKTDGWNPNK